MSGPPSTSWPMKPGVPRMVAISSPVGRTWSSGRDTEGLAASLMRTTGASSTGADEHPARTAHAPNAAIVDRVARIGYLLLRLVGGRGVGGQGGDECLLRHLDPPNRL